MSPDVYTRSVLASWLRERRRFAIALLVDVEGSAPLDPGAMMLVAEDHVIEGSLTGGCVEGALVAEAEQVIAGGGARLSRFGFSDELAGEVGLMCGGVVTVFITRPTDQDARTLIRALEAIDSGDPVALAVLIDGQDAGAWMALIDGTVQGGFGDHALLNSSVARDLPALIDLGGAQIRQYGSDGTVLGVGTRVFIRSFLKPPRMILFGASDFSAATAGFAAKLGYEVTICDPRPPFAASGRYAAAATVATEWPDQFLEGITLGPRDVVLVFTHDPKFDEPAIRAALATDVGYIGALGSRRTAADREARLRASGVGEEGLARLTSPSGHDIGAGTPAETAISILAEVVARRHGREGGSLASAEGPIRARQWRAAEARSIPSERSEALQTSASVTEQEISSSSATFNAPNNTA